MNTKLRGVPPLIVITFMICIAIGYVLARGYSSGSSTEGRHINTEFSEADFYRKAVAKWQAVFLTRDAAVAYRQFIDEEKSMPSEQGHVVAHIVGGILYDLYGLNGLSSCTDDFNYGCYHGLSSRVIERRGIAGISDLTDACRQLSSLDCEHGIGHGLMVIFGDEHLNEALGACSVFGHRTGGCADGVFMEHFLNSMRRDEDKGALAFDDSEPDAPCAAVTGEDDRAVCYYWLPVLWRAKVRTIEPVSAQFAYVGDLCEQVKDTHMRASCFSGAGTQTVLIAEYSTDEIRRLCAAMPPDGRGSCEKEALEYIKRRTHTDL